MYCHGKILTNLMLTVSGNDYLTPDSRGHYFPLLQKGKQGQSILWTVVNHSIIVPAMLYDNEEKTYIQK